MRARDVVLIFSSTSDFDANGPRELNLEPHVPASSIIAILKTNETLRASIEKARLEGRMTGWVKWGHRHRERRKKPKTAASSSASSSSSSSSSLSSLSSSSAPFEPSASLSSKARVDAGEDDSDEYDSEDAVDDEDEDAAEEEDSPSSNLEPLAVLMWKCRSCGVDLHNKAGALECEVCGGRFGMCAVCATASNLLVLHESNCRGPTAQLEADQKEINFAESADLYMHS